MSGSLEEEDQSEKMQQEKQRGRGPEGQRPLIPRKVRLLLGLRSKKTFNCHLCWAAGCTWHVVLISPAWTSRGTGPLWKRARLLVQRSRLVSGGVLLLLGLSLKTTGPMRRAVHRHVGRPSQRQQSLSSFTVCPSNADQSSDLRHFGFGVIWHHLFFFLNNNNNNNFI